MGLMDLFSDKPRIDREPVLRDREQILAYFEQLMRMRAVISLQLEEQSVVAYSATVEHVSEEKGTLVLALQTRPSREPVAKAPVYVWFTLDGLRFRATLSFLQRSGYMQSELLLPECIRHAERREAQRTRFTARENAEVVALQGLFDGLGVSGTLLNLSLGGCSFRVDKALDIRKDRRVPLRGDLLAEGSDLPLLRLQNLPQTPLLDARAQVRHCGMRKEGLVVGALFEGMGSLEFQALERLLSQRLPGFASGFPRKHRRQGDEEEETEAEASEPLQEPQEEAPQPVEDGLDDAAVEELRTTVRSPDRIIQLKKRSRHILLILGDELERIALAGALVEDGYRGLHEARSLVQALDQVRKHPMDLCILSQQVGSHGALEVLDQLLASGRLGDARIVVLKETEDVRLGLAAKAGRVSMVIPRPLDFEGVVKPGLESLLGLTG
jgi:CheY-like chemotaxis protein/c-di-GMP-binding flagellar brake protein YcgR